MKTYLPSQNEQPNDISRAISKKGAYQEAWRQKRYEIYTARLKHLLLQMTEIYNKNKHIGIYGICKKNGKILFIKKARGPYKGLLDLPGGEIEFGENLEKALHREFLEEVGCDIHINHTVGNIDYSSFWENDGVSTHTHHIGLFYEVTLLSDTIKTDADGHDSEGALWVDISEIIPENISPIAHKILLKFLKKA